MSDEAIFDEIGRFNQGYQASATTRPKLDTLPKGGYDLEIVSTEVARTPKSGDVILRMHCKIIAGLAGVGSVIEISYFFRTQENVNYLGADLCTLGFDADQWTGSRPFNAELKKALPQLPGIRFRGQKDETVGKDGKPYHNMYIKSKLPGASRPAASMPAGPPSPPPSGSDIPF